MSSFCLIKFIKPVHINAKMLACLEKYEAKMYKFMKCRRNRGNFRKNTENVVETVAFLSDNTDDPTFFGRSLEML